MWPMLPSGEGNPFLRATVGDMLATQAARVGDREAIVATDRRISYAQLYRDAQRVARGLLALRRPEGRQGRALDARPPGVARGPARLRAHRRGGGGAQHPLQGPRAALHPAAVGRDHARLRRSRGTGGLPRDAGRGAARPGRLRPRRAGRGGVPGAPAGDRARRRSVSRAAWPGGTSRSSAMPPRPPARSTPRAPRSRPTIRSPSSTRRGRRPSRRARSSAIATACRTAGGAARSCG